MLGKGAIKSVRGLYRFECNGGFRFEIAQFVEDILFPEKYQFGGSFTDTNG